MLAHMGAVARLVDVDDAPVLRDRYGLRVPVLELDGQPIAEGRFREEDVRDRLRAAGRLS